MRWHNLIKERMKLKTYIEEVYGTHRGANASFLRDNPDILPQELSRWKKVMSVHLETGEIYKPASKKVTIKNAEEIAESFKNG